MQEGVGARVFSFPGDKLEMAWQGMSLVRHCVRHLEEEEEAVRFWEQDGREEGVQVGW